MHERTRASIVAYSHADPCSLDNILSASFRLGDMPQHHLYDVGCEPCLYNSCKAAKSLQYLQNCSMHDPLHEQLHGAHRLPCIPGGYAGTWYGVVLVPVYPAKGNPPEQTPQANTR